MIGLNLKLHNPLEDRLESNEKECQLLHSLIVSKTVFLDYFHEVRADLFINPSNKAIYHLMQSVQDSNKDMNPASVRNEIKLKSKATEKNAYEDQLDIILSYGPTDTVTNLIKDLDVIRKNRIVYEEIIGVARAKFMNNENIDEIIKSITDSLISMDSQNIDRTTYSEHVEKTMDMIENPEKYKDYKKVRWGEWNRNFGGVIQDRVYLIGGESGSGKTAYVCDLISQLAEDYPDDVAILFYSYEMSQQRIITRLISRKVSFTESKLAQRSRPLNKDEKAQISQAVQQIKNYPLEIVYSSLSDRELKLKTRQFALKNKGKHLIIMLDHIGLVDGNESDLRLKTIRTSKVMKSFATDYKASVFVLTQLKKELTDENNPANRKSYHKPNDSHIMESGALKADADAVILLWRPEMRFDVIHYNGSESFDARGKLWMLNFKNRDGQAPTDIIMGCDIKYSHLYNLNDPFSPEPTPVILEEMMKMQALGKNLMAPLKVPAAQENNTSVF